MKKILTILLILFITNTAHASFWTRIKLWDGADPVISGDTTSTGQGALLTGEHGWDGANWQKISADSLGRQKVTQDNVSARGYVWDNANWQKVSGDSSGIQYVQIKDPRYDGTAVLDGSTEALTTIEYEHHEIHSGSSYLVKKFTDLGSAADVDYVISTSNSTSYAHMVFLSSTEAEATFTLFEDCTVANDGTNITAYNQNRTSTKTCTCFVSRDSTVSVEGAVLFQAKSGSGKKSGGETRASQEIVLKPNKKYVYRISNDTASENWAAVELNFYEHTDRN